MDSYPEIQQISISVHIFIDYGFDFSEQQQKTSVQYQMWKVKQISKLFPSGILCCHAKGFFFLHLKKKKKKALLKLIM